MTISRRNREWFESGRLARLKAEAQSQKSGELSILPQSSHNATAHSFWRQGWNSVTRQDLNEYLNQSSSTRNAAAKHQLAQLRHQLGAQP